MKKSEYIVSIQFYNNDDFNKHLVIVGFLNTSFTVIGGTPNSEEFLRKISKFSKKFMKKEKMDIKKTNFFILSVSKL